MGFLKQFKDMKQSVGAAPEMLAQARALGAQGEQLAAAHQAAAAQQSAAVAASFPTSRAAPGAADLAPIALIHVARVQPGTSLPAKIDRQDPSSIWLELAGTR